VIFDPYVLRRDPFSNSSTRPLFTLTVFIVFLLGLCSGWI